MPRRKNRGQIPRDWTERLFENTTRGQRAAMLLALARLLKQTGYRYRYSRTGGNLFWLPYLREWRLKQLKSQTERIGNDQRTVSSEVA